MPLELRLMSQRMDSHEQEDDRRFHDGQTAFTKFETAVWGKFSSIEAKIDRFDNKLWAIVVLVAVGVITGVVKMVMGH